MVLNNNLCSFLLLLLFTNKCNLTAFFNGNIGVFSLSHACVCSSSGIYPSCVFILLVLSFTSTCQTPLNNFSVSLVVVNCSFCLSTKDFISYSFVKSKFTEYSILHLQGCFSFSSLKISFHYLLACKVSTEKCGASLMWVL